MDDVGWAAVTADPPREMAAIRLLLSETWQTEVDPPSWAGP